MQTLFQTLLSLPVGNQNPLRCPSIWKPGKKALRRREVDGKVGLKRLKIGQKD